MKKAFSLFILACAMLFGGCGFLEEMKFDSARKTSLNNLKQISMGIMLFSEDNDGLLPQSLSELPNLVPDIAIAAFDKSSDAVSKTKGYFSYAYVIPPQTYINADDDKVKDGFIITDASVVPVAFEKPWTLPEYAETIAVLYADGHVDEVPISDVSSRSCEEVLLELLDGKNINPLFKTAMLERAKTEDERR